MQSSKTITAVGQLHSDLTFLAPAATCGRERSSWRLARQVLSTAHRHRTIVDRYERESDSRSAVTSNVTSNDVSVKVNDTRYGAQAATMVLQTRCAGSCLLRGCRSCDGRRTLRRHLAKYISASLELRSHWLPPSIGELVSPCVHRTASCQRTRRLSVSR